MASCVGCKVLFNDRYNQRCRKLEDKLHKPCIIEDVAQSPSWCPGRVAGGKVVQPKTEAPQGESKAEDKKEAKPKAEKKASKKKAGAKKAKTTKAIVE